jgi:hypothetical protein
VETITVIKEKQSFIVDERAVEEIVIEQVEPEEYSVTGWFRWRS